jgi:hypothetical protein
MNTTIGTGQQSVSGTSGSNGQYYVTKFVSETLGITSLSANTWTVNVALGATGGGGATIIWPSDSSTNGKLRVCAYVWRPGTGAKVANIFDTDVSRTTTTGTATEKSQNITVSGAAVTCQVGDVIIFEMWHGAWLTGTFTFTGFFDGTTVTTTDNTNVTNHASFIQTPQDNLFTAPTTAMTVTAKEVNTHLITKV